MNIKIRTTSSSPAYPVVVRQGLVKDIGNALQRRLAARKVIILTNDTVRGLWLGPLRRSLRRAAITAEVIAVHDGERYKNLKTYAKIVAQLQACRADRRTVLLTLGGGVVGDLGGFVAATYMRGIDLVHVPTTLVAQIDASIGGKTAVDSPQAKNTIGSFYNPRLVLADPAVLSTLPERELHNGLFEALKTALVTNRKFLAFIEKNLDALRQCAPGVMTRLVTCGAREKAHIVSRDPFDRNVRASLNFGHTTGHALETAGGYRRLSHGEAVGWGMLVALHISRLRGLNSWPGDHEAYTLIRRLLPKRRWDRIDPHQLWQTMKLDKKAENGAVRFVLLQDIGKPVVAAVNRRTFVRAWSMV